MNINHVHEKPSMQNRCKTAAKPLQNLFVALLASQLDVYRFSI
jgi:hypothetical protein